MIIRHEASLNHGYVHIFVTTQDSYLNSLRSSQNKHTHTPHTHTPHTHTHTQTHTHRKVTPKLRSKILELKLKLSNEKKFKRLNMFIEIS